jgi:hypothetical protein
MGNDFPTTTNKREESINSETILPKDNIPKTSFQEKVNDNKFFEAFASVIEDTVTLEIMTIVEDENENWVKDKGDRKKEQGMPGKRMVTQIKLLNGDITNIIGNRFIENPSYEHLREFHETQVLKGQDIIKGNLECLHKALTYLINIHKQENSQKNE